MKELETERLKLRALTEADTQAIFSNWASDPAVTEYMQWQPHRSIEDTRIIMDYWLSEYSKPDCYRYILELKSDGTPIGMIDVVRIDEKGRPVIGYCSGRKYWGNGYMTEVLKALVAELFANGYDELFIEAVDDNKASCRVIEKAGFEYLSSHHSPLSPVKPDIVLINSYHLKKGK